MYLASSPLEIDISDQTQYTVGKLTPVKVSSLPVSNCSSNHTMLCLCHLLAVIKSTE